MATNLPEDKGRRGQFEDKRREGSRGNFGGKRIFLTVKCLDRY